MMTPAEAAAVWCPMARIGVKQYAGGPSAVNDPGTDFRGNCIANQCAMWRWGTTVTVRMRESVPDGAGGFKLKDVAQQVPEKGYCGLAGEPALWP